jgi:hypothetical protein
LPSTNIIVGLGEREVIGSNLPALIAGLPDEVKANAGYLFRFVAGAGYGLFNCSVITLPK